MKKNPTAVIVGVFLILVSLFIFCFFSFKKICLNQIASWSVYLTGSAGIALLCYLLTGKITYKDKDLKATGGIALFVILTFSSRAVFKFEDCNRSFSFNVKPYFKNRDFFEFSEAIKVRIIFNGDTKVILVEDGKAYFHDINTNFIGKGINIEIMAQTFQSINPDSLYELSTDATYQVALKRKDLDNLFGTITDQTGKGVDSAKISVPGVVPVFSSLDGSFRINIPDSLQNIKLHFMIEKKGFENYGEYEDVSASHPIDFQIKKR